MVAAAVLASRVPGPSLLWDGQGYLGAARWVARDDWPLLGELDFYHPAYGALLAPSIWAGASPMGLFRWAQAVNVLAIAACALALGALARTLLPEGRTWVLATAAGCAYPALVVQAGFEWPEAAFAAVFALAALAAWRGRWLGLAMATVGLYALHPRGLGVVLVTAAVLVTRRRWPAIAVLLAGTAAVQLVNRLALDALYNPGRRSAAGAAADTITDVADWPDLALRAAGHGWYLLVATLGLAGAAVWSLVRTRRPADLWLLGAVAAVLAASAIQLADRGRADHLVYGRYVESMAPVLVVVAARALRPVPLLVSLGAAAVLGAVAVAGNPDGALDGVPAWVNVPVLALFDEIDVARTTLAALAAALAVGLVGLRAPAVALAGVAAYGLATGWHAHVDELERFASEANATYVMGDQLPALAPISYDIAAYDALASNRYQWEQPGLELDYWSAGDEPGAAVLARKGRPPVPGARVAAMEPRRDLAAWVVPGPRFDELAAQGRLVLELGAPVDGTFDDVEVEPLGGGRVRLTRGPGTAPWVPYGALPGDVGLVRLRAGGEDVALPDLLHPGESVVLRLPSGATTLEVEHVHHGSLGTFEVRR